MAAGMPVGVDPWKILPAEKSKYDAQFVQLKPVGGVVTGDQARGFFLQSQLPPAVLGQIWALADTNSDGKMDSNEFAIAMKLVQLRLKGHELPKALPPSLKITMTATGGVSAPLPLGLPPPPHSALAGPRPVVLAGPVAGFPVAPFGMIAPPMGINSAMFGAAQPSASLGGAPMAGVMPAAVVAVGQPIRPASPVDVKMQRSGSATSQESPTGSVGSPLQEWAVPHQSKLKYTQLFNTNDRMRSGYLTGPQASHLLVQTGLAQGVLAQIWSLADMDNDGRLTCEEFCVALHLSDCVRAGDKLPSVLPADLVPPSLRKKRSPSLTGTAPGVVGAGIPGGGGPQAGSAAAATDLSGLSQEERALRALMMNTFEDKRRENFEKGQAELERRRQSLLENQRKEQEERERKEREEQEKRDKIRQDQERRRQVELEKQLAKQREMEQEKEEQRRKAMEQREAARREMERQRQLEWEKQRRQELLSQRQKEQERVLQLKAQNQNLGIELEQLNEKVKDLNQKITNTRNGVADIKGIIDTMRITRDSKVSELEMLKRQIKEQNLKLIHLNQEKSTLGDQVKVNAVTNPTSDAFNLVMNSFSNKQITLKNLKDRLGNTETEVAQKLLDIGANSSQLATLREQVRGLAASADSLYRTYEEKRSHVLVLKQQRGGGSTVATTNGEDSSGGGAAVFGSEWEKEAWPSDVAATANAAWTANAEPTAAVPAAADWDEAGGAWPPGGEEDTWPAAGDDGWAESAGGHGALGAVNGTSGAAVLKYRALYAFDARNPDELPIMPGDIVTVFPDQSTEPGWLSGRLSSGQQGWFPEAYAEPLTENGGGVAGGADAEEAETSGGSPTSLHGLQETVHIVGTEMKMTLSGIQEAPESISDNGSIGGEPSGGDNQPSAFIQVLKSTVAGAASPVPGQGQSVEGLQVTALFPWRAKKENHLSFNKGDLITIQEQQDIWWYGELDGRQGWFPKSYVKATGGAPAAPGNAATSAGKRQSDGAVGADAAGQNDAFATTSSQLSSEDYYMAMYSYQSMEPGDLMFNQGDFISVIKMDGDWWTGTIGDRTGIFPSNYVKRMDELQDGDTSMPQEPPPETKGGRKPNIAAVIAPYVATGPEQLSLQKGQLISVKKRNQSGWWEGELHAKGKKRQVGWFPASYVKLLSSGDNSARSTPELGRSADDTRNDPTNAAPKEQVVALYPYTAQNEDELSFVKDAVISVVSKEDAAWWRGEYDGHIGVFPANYVLEWDGSAGITDSQRTKFSGLDPTERKRQELINELIATEESYVEDMSIVLDAFYKPLKESRILSDQELETIFVNWNDLIVCNTKFLKSFRVRRKMSKKAGGAIHMIGDILCENLPNLTPYMRFCCCQLNAAAIIQNKTENSQEFRDLTKKCCLDPRTKGMPISSFLLKPMQRITKYPLLIKKILENTPETHSDYHNLVEALGKAEDMCSQVNEGVREQENSDRLEHVQRVVSCDNLEEKITFNSLTNSLGPRKFLHSGMLVKVNSGKELMAFLFNDFLLLTQPCKNFGSVGSLFALDRISSSQFKMYKQPILINQVDAKKSEGSEDGVNFQLACGERTYLFKAVSPAERNVWVRKLESAAVHYRDVEHRKNLKSQSFRRRSAVGNLRIIILGATDLVLNKAKGRSDPYCEASMGSQEHRTKVINDTVNPKWNASMQFIVKDPNEDVLCVTVYDRDYFSPNDFLGRTEIRIAEIIHKSSKKVGPVILKKQLHEVETGDITLKLDIQLFS